MMVPAEALGPRMANFCLENVSLPVDINHCPFQVRQDAMYLPPNGWSVFWEDNAIVETQRWPLLLAERTLSSSVLVSGTLCCGAVCGLNSCYQGHSVPVFTVQYCGGQGQLAGYIILFAWSFSASCALRFRR